MKNTALWLLLFGSFSLLGQNTGADRQFAYGLLAGAEFQTLNIGLQPRQPDVPLVSPQQLTGAGADFGIWGQWPISPVFKVRPALQLAHLTNTIQFEHSDGRIIRNRYRFTDIELPLHFILTDDFQRLPVKALILFGGRLSWNLAALPAETPLKLLPERAGLDLGIGAGFRWGKWTIQPELIYSYGMNNVHDFQNTSYDWAVGRVLRDRLSLRVVVAVED